MKQNKKLFINTFVSTTYVLSFSIIQLVFMVLIIFNYKSWQFNGFLRTTMSMVGFLGSAESGIGIMCSVFLYKTLLTKDWITANSIISTTKKQNRILGYTSIVILILISFVYGGYVVSSDQVSSTNHNLFIGGGISTFFCYVFVIMLMGSKNLVSLFWTGTYENLMIADQNNYMRMIVYLAAELIVYGLVFWLVSLNVFIIFIFLPIPIYSIIKSTLIMIFIKKRYPWIKPSKLKDNKTLKKNAFFVTVAWIGDALLNNFDLLIISLVVGLNISSGISFFIAIAAAIRLTLMSLIHSFKAYFAKYTAKYGRVHWEKYNIYELYTYMVGAFCFITIFMMSPYIVNSLFNSKILINMQRTKDTLNTYKDTFLKPSFALIIATGATIILLTEPINSLIYAKNNYKQTALARLIFGIVGIFTSFITGLLVMAYTDKSISAIYAILIIHIVFIFLRYIYLWFYNWIYLTYNSNYQSTLKNLLILLIPIITSIVIMYELIYPNESLTFNASKNAFQSLVSLKWSLTKFFSYVFIEAASSILYILLIGLIFSNKLVYKLIIKFKVLNNLFESRFIKSIFSLFRKDYLEYQYKSKNFNVIKETDTNHKLLKNNKSLKEYDDRAVYTKRHPQHEINLKKHKLLQEQNKAKENE